MIVVRRNKDKNSLQAFNAYLKLEDETEHEIPGVVLVKQFQDGLPKAGCGYVCEIHVDDHFIRFEE